MGGPARPNRRRPRLARDERDLSDEVARAEPGHEATLAYHVGLAFEDDHELASPGAFRITSRGPGRLNSSASEAISASSRLEHPAKSGTCFSSSIFASLRSATPIQ